MQGITFAVPTLPTAEMSRQDQIDIVVNQATSAIVCCYLEHLNALLGTVQPGALVPVMFLHTPQELTMLVNDVQNALRTVN